MEEVDGWMGGFWELSMMRGTEAEALWTGEWRLWWDLWASVFLLTPLSNMSRIFYYMLHPLSRCSFGHLCVFENWALLKLGIVKCPLDMFGIHGYLMRSRYVVTQCCERWRGVGGSVES